MKNLENNILKPYYCNLLLYAKILKNRNIIIISTKESEKIIYLLTSSILANPYAIAAGTQVLTSIVAD